MRFEVSVLILFLAALVVYALPVLLIARSPRSEGQSKAIWVIAALIGSWLALLAFYLATPHQNAMRD